MLILMRSKKLVSILTAAVMLFAILAAGAPYKEYPVTSFAGSIPDTVPSSNRHLRATWICTVINMDWPTKEVLKAQGYEERIQKSKDELCAILDRSVELNLNAVFFQVSPEGDAFYKSDLVPWSRYLTGTFGRDPCFAPLEFAIEEAHKRNLEIHAWFNPYRVSMDTKDATKASLNVEKSVYKEHLEWIRTCGGRFVLDPGIPEARHWVTDRIMEVLNGYDVDGIHFDDYFYTEGIEGELKDKETYEKYNKGQFSNIGDWRRNNTYLLIKEVSEKVRTAKPWVKFGVSPSAIWGNKKDGHPDGSNTNTTYTNYEKCFADTKKWVKEELLDYIAPQIYFTFSYQRASYSELANWWANVCKGKNVHLYIGQALYKVNDDSDQDFKGTNAVKEFSRQLQLNSSTPQITGSIMFRYSNFNDSGKADVVNSILGGAWSSKALIPAMPWKGGKAPSTAQNGKLAVLSKGLNISWTDTDSSTAYYAVYRLNKADVRAGQSNSYKLVGTIRKDSLISRQEFTDLGTSDAQNTVYLVTSLDRLHNESSGLKISINQSDYFPDTGDNYYWAVKSIDNLFEKGIVKGDERGFFNPGKNTTRADFILMVVRALNLTGDFSDNFSDVASTSYYYDALGVAKSLGIAKGSNNKFYPNANITREDMMVIIERAVNTPEPVLVYPGDESLAYFSDRNLISTYAREAVASLTSTGLVQGDGGKINPQKMATRAEIAVIIDRLLEYLQYNSMGI